MFQCISIILVFEFTCVETFLCNQLLSYYSLTQRGAKLKTIIKMLASVWAIHNA